MGKQHTDQRDRTLTLARILYDETDELHPLPMTGLMERLEKAGVPSERKSVYRDMAALRRHGMAVEYRPGREGGWYLTGRAFERTELRQLTDAVAAYRWLPEPVRASLLDKLAAQRGISKLDAYREAIRGIGGVSDTICATEKAAPKLVENWSHNGIGWFAETMPSKIDGCVNVILYYGSSTYDTKQMSSLIDHIVQDCKAVGIETKPPHELAALEQAWR